MVFHRWFFPGSEAKHATEYISPSGNTVQYSGNAHAWLTVPYVTSGSSGASRLNSLSSDSLSTTTRLSTKLVINGRGKHRLICFEFLVWKPATQIYIVSTGSWIFRKVLNLWLFRQNCFVTFDLQSVFSFVSVHVHGYF